MPIVVTGSIATDHLMTFSGSFAEQLLPDQLHRVSLSFLVDDLDVRRGGVAANICVGLSRLGLRPVLVGAVGMDFADDRSWLDRHGVDTASVRVSELRHTARFVCTTDREHNQIASFYAGAMSEAHEIELGPIADRVGGVDLVVISPNDPAAMLRHTQECRQRGLAFAADPSQQLAVLEPAQIRELVSGAAYLFTNAYEAALIEAKTGWSAEQVLGRVQVRVTTLGADGAVVQRRGEQPVRVPAPPEERRLDPTGVGDAFRAGFLATRSWGLGLQRAAQVGSLLATHVLESAGGAQDYGWSSEAFVTRFAASYGATAAGEVASRLAG